MTGSRARHNLLWILEAAIIVVSCLFVLCLKGRAASVQSYARGRVLFISSYSYSWDTVRMQIEGITGALASDVVLDYEYMDTYRVNDEKAVQLFYEGLKYRLSRVEPYDVIIVGDDAALRFAMTYREELFAGIPLVFEGINNAALAREAAKDPKTTGVLEELSIEENINFGLRLNSQAVRVVAILDDSITGQVVRDSYYSYQKTFPNLEFLEINCSRFTVEELQSELQQVSKYSILLYFLMAEGADGKKFSNVEAMKLISDNVKVPTISMLESGIGQGLLGGQVASLKKSGEIAGQLAMDILDGQDVLSSTDVIASPNMYFIDQKIMKKFNLNRSALPKDAVLLNDEESFLERNREALIPAAILFIALLVIIGVVCLDNLRGRKLQKELGEAKTIMESASQHDFLTGLPNRSKFTNDLEQIVAEKKPCTIIMLDIDDFKKINDTLGHKAGDEALKQVAARLKELTSPILTAYRYAGDEFIMIQQSSQRKIVEKTAYNCRQLFSKEFVLAGEKRKIFGSIGLACYPDDTDNMEQLIVYADDAMYQVKKNGKNDFAFYQKREAKPDETPEEEQGGKLGGAEVQEEPSVTAEDKPEE